MAFQDALCNDKIEFPNALVGPNIIFNSAYIFPTT